MTTSCGAIASLATIGLAAIAVTAAAAMAGCGHAAATRAPPGPDLVFAIVADTHVGKDGKLDAARQMAQAVAEINASPAEMTIFLGDLVDSGGSHEQLYPEWLKIARGLKRPFYSVPGNHDPAALFTKHLRPQTDYVADVKAVRFIFFADATPDSHDGAVTPDQVRWIAAQADDAAARRMRVILCTHIPRHPNKDPDMGWYIRGGEKEMADMVRTRAGTILVILSGHLHSGLRIWSDWWGVQEVAAPSLCWNFGKDLGGAGGFAVGDKRPAWLLAELWGDELRLRYMSVGTEPQTNVTLKLPPAPK